jgi:hypothetical protein
MKKTLFAIAICLFSTQADAFCGFYVGKADASLFNESSKVVYARHDNKNVISMMNDYKGDLNEFALVVPVPVVLQKGQIHVGDPSVFKHIDAYSAPRLVEYFDNDPCQPQVMYEMRSMSKSTTNLGGAPNAQRAGALGVKVEAEYTVGEYDIVILSAKESNGLETWLTESGYKIPRGAARALQPYIKQSLKFFVAKVNLKEQTKTGLTYLRPLQFAFDSPKFMLPIRLGMLNAKGPQDLILYVLTRDGRVETTNYRTLKVPSGHNIPMYVRDEFPEFYKAMFSRQAKSEGYKVVFTEYFWNMNWCDPCAADPLSSEELRQLGVFWTDSVAPVPGFPGRPVPWKTRILPPGGGAAPVMVTRLHIRYTPETFPEDLMFQETKDQENFQGRYVLQHPWKGDEKACPQARAYFRDLKKRQEHEAQTLANLTGWNIDNIRDKMKLPAKEAPWWDDLWK